MHDLVKLHDLVVLFCSGASSDTKLSFTRNERYFQNSIYVLPLAKEKNSNMTSRPARALQKTHRATNSQPSIHNTEFNSPADKAFTSMPRLPPVKHLY